MEVQILTLGREILTRPNLDGSSTACHPRVLSGPVEDAVGLGVPHPRVRVTQRH